MPRDAPPAPPDDLAEQIELRTAADAPRGNALPALVRWLRRVRDRERARMVPFVPPAIDQADAGEAGARAG
jgi:hypothetical protein